MGLTSMDRFLWGQQQAVVLELNRSDFKSGCDTRPGRMPLGKEGCFLTWK